MVDFVRIKHEEWACAVYLVAACLVISSIILERGQDYLMVLVSGLAAGLAVGYLVGQRVGLRNARMR